MRCVESTAAERSQRPSRLARLLRSTARPRGSERTGRSECVMTWASD
jgi:hypothetical protein